MGLEFLRGDIFASGAYAIAIPVNCVGVPGAGLAKQFADRHPKATATYVRRCKAGLLRPGEVIALSKTPEVGVIVCVPTKRHWRDPSLMDDVISGIKALRETAEKMAFPSLAIPALGCGLGGLRWVEVRPVIVQAFKDTKIDVKVYEP